ncbi:hypothetical protein DPMN_132500 [Dreissena polymorpha]|uniref:Uncharacterized protein n=1 Tax=Dreissena polymorpha TaxID=45954 RepID=A0A9D4FSK9_DREPO|nr:hypothetical protein DPMN_132500 [Dreissena polymorpha]
MNCSWDMIDKTVPDMNVVSGLHCECLPESILSGNRCENRKACFHTLLVCFLVEMCFR